MTQSLMRNKRALIFTTTFLKSSLTGESKTDLNACTTIIFYCVASYGHMSNDIIKRVRTGWTSVLSTLMSESNFLLSSHTKTFMVSLCFLINFASSPWKFVTHKCLIFAGHPMKLDRHKDRMKFTTIFINKTVILPLRYITWFWESYILNFSYDSDETN